jgi:sugar phosphate isomerase/epimerase
VSLSPPRKPRVHVHVPYDSFRKYLPVLREHRLSVELYFGSNTVDDIREADLHMIAEAMDWEHTMSIHGPFMDLSPGAIDPKIAAASLERYHQILSFSEILKPDVVVFHSGYEAWKYGSKVHLWLEPSLRTWGAVMERAEKTGVGVAIENIVDSEPDHLRMLCEKVGHPRFGLCLDAGHREIFSNLPITAWVDGMHPYILEMHLHDNGGEADDHNPIGEGTVDFPALFKRVGELCIDPVYTLEAHSAEDALMSLGALNAYLKTMG